MSSSPTRFPLKRVAGIVTLLLLSGGCKAVAPYDRAPSASDTLLADARLDAGLDGVPLPDRGGDVAPEADLLPRQILFVDARWDGATPGVEVEPGHVYGEDAFATISEALSRVEPSGIIRVRGGIYHEAVVIDQPGVYLEGVGSPVLDGDPNADGAADLSDLITIAASGVAVVGFELRNGKNGIFVRADQGAVVDGVVILGNIVHDMLNEDGEQGVGILAWGRADGVQIRDNEVYDNDRQGIYVGHTPSGVGTVGGVIVGNTVYNNGLDRKPNGLDAVCFGVQVQESSRIAVKTNDISAHRNGGFGVGVYLQNASLCSVTDNALHDNQYGVRADDDAKHAVVNNDLYENDYGLVVGQGALGPMNATDNRFCRNSAYGAKNESADASINASNSWWGAVDGPGPLGSGDSVVGTVSYDPFLTTQPPGGPCGPGT